MDLDRNTVLGVIAALGLGGAGGGSAMDWNADKRFKLEIKAEEQKRLDIQILFDKQAEANQLVFTTINKQLTACLSRPLVHPPQ